ncbi:hypothetical protein JG687_00005840 [Phytophthora cactorum]|uniref:Uncharacterized protein n=1 Tax=Phytophthora cactorum TaxID=29920 RepID=A0A8T1UK13_9STRA|nr:hypothetical protein JG687_00005840 [Phytophthora cactorum]
MRLELVDLDPTARPSAGEVLYRLQVIVRIFDNFHAKDSDSYAIDNHLCPCIDDCHTDIDHFDSKGTDDGTTTDGFKHHLKRIRYNIFGPRQPKLVRIDIFANDYNTARNDIIAVNRYGRSKCSGELHEQHE